MKIIVDKNIPYIKGVAEHFGEVEYLAGTDFTKERIKDADTLIVRTVVRLDKDLLEGTKVKLICSATIGYDHIDTDYCDAHGIAWRNAPGCNSGSVQQYIVSSLIVLSMQASLVLKGKTIGIIGVGNVGTKVARACETLGMKVLLNDPPRQELERDAAFFDLETIKREADIITFHTPLTKEGKYKTYYLAGDSFFSSLSKKPLIINSARGSIVDTAAIKNAMKEDKISGMIIDCWEDEPGIDLEYMRMADIATPHIAGYSADGKANASRISLTNIAGFYNLDRAPVSLIKVPEPEYPVIDLNKFDSHRIERAILATYNPMGDFERLRNDPGQFKDLRNAYPLRREPLAYTVTNALPEEAAILESLGFNL